MSEIQVMLLMGRVDDTYVDAAHACMRLVRSLRPDHLAHPISACPPWTVHDAVAHMCGAADLVTYMAQSPRSGFEQWSHEQFLERRRRPVEDMLTEWEAAMPDLGRLIVAKRIYGDRLVSDVAIREQDIRGAVGLPGGRDSRGYGFAFNLSIKLLGCRIREAGLPALRLSTDLGSWRAGFGRPTVTVVAPAFELNRALSGRRSLAQIAAFRWNGESGPYLPLIPRARSVECAPPERDIVEAA